MADLGISSYELEESGLGFSFRKNEELNMNLSLKGKKAKDFLNCCTKEEIEKIAKDIFEKMKPVAEEQLKKYFILEKIAEIEKIDVSEDEIDQVIKRISMTSGEDFDQVKKRLTDSGRIYDIKDDIRIEKAFELIKNSAQVIKRIIVPGEENERKKE